MVGRMRSLVVSPRSELRLARATSWLCEREPGREVLVVGSSAAAAGEAIRGVAARQGAAFGMHRFTLARLAAELAKHELIDRDLAAVGGLPIEALCARVIQRLRREGTLGRFEAVATQPGMPRALARTLLELRMAGADREAHELGPALRALELELASARLADRSIVFRFATAVTEDPARRGLLLGLDLAVLDTAVHTVVEQRLIAALAARASSAFATAAFGDDRSIARLATAFVCVPDALVVDPAASSLARVQAHLFAPQRHRAELDATIEIFSAPGESREAVEIARRVLRAAEGGMPFDRMAVLLRSPEAYRVHLEEALTRAQIPVHFAQGTRLPDPTGRAFLALLACAAEQLSATRFAEYVSLGEVPHALAPPSAVPSGDRWVPPEEELLPTALAAPAEEVVPELESLLAALGLASSLHREDPADQADPAHPADLEDRAAERADIAASAAAEHADSGPLGGVFAPWRWEQLLVDAAVIGGLDRWARRLAGLEAQLALEVGEQGRERRERAGRDLDQLRTFALPLIGELARLPAEATWGGWIDVLGALATRALRQPERVLGVLATLVPMSEVGPISLREVQLVLGARLAELVVRPTGARYGALFVAPIDEARGRSFDLVFVPGLAERMFPQKLAEDPLLLDAARAQLEHELGFALERRDDRLSDERLALRLALGAATERLVLSYPRLDLEQGRPRVPSFYGLEVLEAAEGTLPGFDELGRRANVTGAARIGWPAPSDPRDAIDEAEHDLALLDELVRPPPGRAAPMGAANFLLRANPHLARALRARSRRWDVRSWKPADGFIVTTPEARVALAAHLPSARSFSPTALEQFAPCPYRFVLRTIVRLEARATPAPIETLGPLERGSLIHEVQFELLGELRGAGMLPLTPAGLTDARDRLDATLDRVAARYHDDLFPAIERVWSDGVSSIRADLREWLRRMVDDAPWVPSRFELAFGLATQVGRDPASSDEPATLPIGLTLRGSIDLVEQGPNGLVRATDYKTGKAKVASGSVISGGTSLQPILYALVLEALLPEANVAGGRLYYCTTRGDFQDVMVPLDDAAREAGLALVATLGHHFDRGFFPAAPDHKACVYCDYRRVCGPHEEQRTRRKQPEPLVQLEKLRKRP